MKLYIVLSNGLTLTLIFVSYICLLHLSLTFVSYICLLYFANKKYIIIIVKTYIIVYYYI